MSETMAAVLDSALETAPPVSDNSERSPRRIHVPGMGSLLLRGKTWWACYYVNGKEHRESARQPSEGFVRGDLKDAKQLLRKRVARSRASSSSRLMPSA
jgi:hypothetical protein